MHRFSTCALAPLHFIQREAHFSEGWKEQNFWTRDQQSKENYYVRPHIKQK